MRRTVLPVVGSILIILCLALAPVIAADQTRITMEFKEADLLDVLRVLGKMSGKNIIADRTVRGAVTLSLVDVPFEDAIDLIARTAGFGVTCVGNTFVVATQDRIASEFAEKEAPPPPPAPVPTFTKVYQLQHASPAEVMGSLDLIVPPDRMRPDDRTSSLVVTASEDDHARISELIGELDRPKHEAPPPPAPEAYTKVYRLFYATPDEAIKSLDLVLPADRMRADERTSSVIVTATKNLHEKVAALIKELDTPKPQVLIQARLEELSGDALRDLGVNWNFSTLLSKDSLGRTVGVDVGIEPILKIMEDEGKAVLLARPEISTLDGQTARMLIGDRVPVVIDEMVDGELRRTIQNIEAGVKLTITPRVNEDGVMTATIKPEISTITGFTSQGYPQIRTREAETTIRIRDGQTVAIGGLFQTDEIEQMMKVPILSELPVLGGLFRNRKVEWKESEIVIFLTTHIIEGTDFSKAGKELRPVSGDLQKLTPGETAPAQAGTSQDTARGKSSTKSGGEVQVPPTGPGSSPSSSQNPAGMTK